MFCLMIVRFAYRTRTCEQALKLQIQTLVVDELALLKYTFSSPAYKSSSYFFIAVNFANIFPLSKYVTNVIWIIAAATLSRLAYLHDERVADHSHVACIAEKCFDNAGHPSNKLFLPSRLSD